MTPHPESHAFNEIRFLLFDTVFPYSFKAVVNSENIIPIDLNRFHSVTDSFVRYIGATELFRNGCAQSISVVFNKEDDGQAPDCRQVKRFVEIPFTGATLTRESQGHFIFIFQFAGQGHTVCHCQLGTEVRDHSADMMLPGPEMKASFPSVTVSRIASLPL